ncbi:GNAT family N-acetyltransferase [Priestia taiwanensis]|uniref:N-acetyltransferase n=1 Tax=Priestia taiwanensis TaxID=1347902 RepID=A0A917ANJ3_9BACI|nr:GNAT family N-acetyltransferase [Priestia taiwanensis]MBM7362198.1 putative GNAT superfamily acetyltransferase [Priestia taiwanensis]GGE60173.1 N-acetyltransferase [Priestia taiwanensis]
MNHLHESVFGEAKDIFTKLETKDVFVINLAFVDYELVGYKVGYKLNQDTFYSWLGGVNPSYRGAGIASALMEAQHEYLWKKGYKVVQTKTMNRWRNMLILNIKSGFDIVHTYIDKQNEVKIVLEKKLVGYE